MAKKILIIEDNHVDVKIILPRLEQEGFLVAVADDGVEGLEKVETFNPDLILLDIEMPKMNGYDFMSELQKIVKYKDTPVIVQTAYDELQPIFDFKSIKGFVVKPLNAKELILKINDCLEGNAGF